MIPLAQVVVVWLLNVAAKRTCISRTDLRRQLYWAATLRQKLQITFAISFSHIILTLGQPVQTLILRLQASGRVTTREPIHKSLV